MHADDIRLWVLADGGRMLQEEHSFIGGEEQPIARAAREELHAPVGLADIRLEEHWEREGSGRNVLACGTRAGRDQRRDDGGDHASRGRGGRRVRSGRG